MFYLGHFLYNRKRDESTIFRFCAITSKLIIDLYIILKSFAFYNLNNFYTIGICSFKLSRIHRQNCLDPTCEEFRINHPCLHNKKGWTNWKSTALPRFIRELRSLGHLLPPKLERKMDRISQLIGKKSHWSQELVGTYK